VKGDNVLDRRTVLASSLLASLATPAAYAQTRNDAEIVRLWSKSPPGGPSADKPYKIETETHNGHTGRSVSGVTEPTLLVHRAAKAADTAILVLPGGGFTRIMQDKEGEDICALLNSHGISAGTLLYRLPGDGWHSSACVFDAKRAVRVLAERTGAKRIGLMGFSAGGTIAAAVASRWDDPVLTWPSTDAADALTVRPAFMALGYPWLNLPSVPKGFNSPYYSMNAKTPPAFFFLAADDHEVTPDNSINGFHQLHGLQVPAALHIFQTGDHGFALRAPPDSPEAQWPELFLHWAKEGGHIV